MRIVDYCWGRGECNVPEGAIRDTVAWFAILLDRDGEGVFIARRNPGPAGRASDDIFFQRGVAGLTVVAETIKGPLMLPNIGSGANWVGYHVVAHLALHKLFRARNRPVPAILMLDQPSQAYYPPERDIGELDVHDEDQIAVTRLYGLLLDYCTTTETPMQIIVMDHVELLQEWFRGAIRERWRDGIKLVPVSWLTQGMDE